MRKQDLFKFHASRTRMAFFLAALTAFSVTAIAAETPQSFNLMDARERGVTATGNAKGTITPTFDEALKKDVLELACTVSGGEAVTVWTKQFPATLTPASVNTVKANVKTVAKDPVAALSAQIVLTGSLGSQEIPVRLKAGSSSVQESVAWNKIGVLTGAELRVSAASGSPAIGATLSLSLDFINQVAAKPLAAAVKAPAAVVVKPAVARTSFNILDAIERGTDVTGNGKGSVMPTFDEAAGKDILEFDYSVPKGATVKAWARNFPGELNGGVVNTLKIGMRLLDPGQDSRISVKVELKGNKGVQTIPIPLKAGWNSAQENINWAGIGNLQEAAFVVTAIPGAARYDGTINLSMDFIKLATPLRVKTSDLPAYSLFDAGEKGVFNIGPSKGTIRNVFDDKIAQDVWAFDYNLPMGSIVGIWSKSYPAELKPCAADSVKVGVTVPDAEQLNQVSVKLEIKGAKAMQSVPLTLKKGRNCLREHVSWNAIGELKEVVFVVSPMAVNPQLGNPLWFNPMEGGLKNDNKAFTGTLYFDLEFKKLSFFQKNFTLIKTALVLILALVLGGLSALVCRIGRQNQTLDGLSTQEEIPSPSGESKATFLSHLKWDFFFGILIVLIAGVTFKIYSLGMVGSLDAGFGFSFLGVGCMGAVIAELLKLKFTGKHLTPSEVFRNVVLTGILAASSSKMELLQAPASWNQMFMISNLTAAVAFVIYQIFNASSLSSSGKHLKTIAGIMIVGTPYLFGWLLLLENVTLLASVFVSVSGGFLSAWPAVLDIFCKILVAFIFNEAVANGMGLITKGRTLQGPSTHGFIFLVSAAVVISPLIATLGSLPALATWPVFARGLAAVAATMLSYAGLWGEVYLITGILLDAGHNKAPVHDALTKHVTTGMRKGMAYSGILMAMLYILNMILGFPAAQKVMTSTPILIGVLAGAALFPLLKTIIETFDGSLRFFERTRYSYQDWTLFLRGAVVGYGFSAMITQGMFQKEMSDRIVFGLLIGFLASGGVSLLRDVIYALRGQGKIQSWRLYLVDSCLGIFVGTATAFYLDARQVPVVIEKFKLYTSAGFSPVDYVTYPLLNKWGRIDLGSYTGGAKLIYLESLAGVINWSVAAWLFAINKVFMQAYFDRDTSPIKFFFSKQGFAQLVEHMIYVLRWGLWMSPIIFTFLRMMPDPTWYNQDGAIRTFFAIVNNATMSPDAFRAWSLQVFVCVMAFDFFRVLIWMDHMGLRVATLVNLSFLGMDKLDEKVSRFIGSAAAQRYIPEGVKRFTTWGPLLIPFYLPRGEAWDYAWSTSEAMQNGSRGKGFLMTLQTMSLPELAGVIACGILICTAISYIVRFFGRRSRARQIASIDLTNREYRVTARENGEIYSEVLSKEFFDVTRRSYDTIDPCGRMFYLLDTSTDASGKRTFWPVAGNFPKAKFQPSAVLRGEGCLKIINQSHGIKTTIAISLPDPDATAEIWTITLENLTGKARHLKMIPYLEWVLNGWIHDRFHTQYARLYPEMEYSTASNAILTWHKATKSMGFLASDVAPEGFLTGRVDFIGRCRSLWSPRVFETLAFHPAKNTSPYPTFDPIGSLMIDAAMGPKSNASLRLIIGYAKNKAKAVETIQKYLRPQPARQAVLAEKKKMPYLIGHGEVPPGTPQPYSEFIEGGNKLAVHTPYTPRPIDHAMSNPIHSVMVTNRGLHTSCNGNSQQNRLTPDWADTVTKEIPNEAIYLFEPERGIWYSPTFHPVNDTTAKHTCQFGVDGTAVFHMAQAGISTELTVFVPPSDPLGVYLLKVRNDSDQARTLRVAPYFQMCLGFMPEKSGPLHPRFDRKLKALFYENCRNIFRSGPAFVAISSDPDAVETRRGRFFGESGDVCHPYFLQNAQGDSGELKDDAEIASFLTTLRIEPRGEQTIAILLGQTDDRKQAPVLIRKYQDLATVHASLEETKRWWLGLMSTVEVKTSDPSFNEYQNWLKYQALAERIWPRRGFYQTSGAYGYRDQLQDTVNLMWVDPSLARNQIKLCASQQFIQGDVFHWFFTLTDGRTAFSCRSHASDNPLWLAWAVGEYIRVTEDFTILDEMTSYVVSEFPFAKLPQNKQGWGHLYHRTTRGDTIYRHCMRSIDLVLNDRTGKNGLPLIQTGDWNDGLDEIGSEGKGESVWLGFFLYYILKEMTPIIELKDGVKRKEHYLKKMRELGEALEKTWRSDRYLRAFHDDGTEIGLKDSGIWEIDALTASWAVMSGINFERGLTVFNTAVSVLEKGDTILLGWPALREDTKPYLGRSSKYPEGVRENGMYCHGVQWLVRAARLLAEEFDKRGNRTKADEYRETAYRLWQKISPIPHVTPENIEIYGGQPNKQAADFLTTFDRGRMIWHGYTGAAGWMLRQAMEGVVGATLLKNQMILPSDLDRPRGKMKVMQVSRDVSKSPLRKVSLSGSGENGTSCGCRKSACGTAVKTTEAVTMKS